MYHSSHSRSDKPPFAGLSSCYNEWLYKRFCRRARKDLRSLGLGGRMEGARYQTSDIRRQTSDIWRLGWCFRRKVWGSECPYVYTHLYKHAHLIPGLRFLGEGPRKKHGTSLRTPPPSPLPPLCLPPGIWILISVVWCLKSGLLFQNVCAIIKVTRSDRTKGGLSLKSMS